MENAREPALADVLGWIWRRKVSIASGVLLGIALAGAYYVLAKPVYSSDIVVMPVDDSSSDGQLSGLIGQLGGVGSLLGMNIGGETTTQRNLAVFKSRAFLEQFIQTRDLLPTLFEKRWDAQAKQWKNDGKDPPSLAEGVRKFEKLRTIAEDRRAGLVTVSIRWKDAKTASRWANDLIAYANQILREQAIRESETTILYLEGQITSTQEVGVRDALFRVLESQMKTMTLARTRHEYAFRIIDPAQPPLRRDRVSPRLIPTAFTGVLLGGLLGLLAGLILQRFRREKS